MVAVIASLFKQKVPWLYNVQFHSIVKRGEHARVLQKYAVIKSKGKSIIWQLWHLTMAQKLYKKKRPYGKGVPILKCSVSELQRQVSKKQGIK